ncbi:adenosylcobinamide-GDP ribazoletransferase [Wenxinia saemankumensis]|uniref:Adenosylcobinamide-GDP ribazoletransferase n=1 Tax=Wenxinia saemankumensis TaxID=1447782 RepID=A0A1M6ESP3_9RHOB|nr:adenosylcobinamide-GDP ribazoletransferase [Wenxinia saemankumensis]SHI88416.1 cobalamin-5'-phosphate synthase [Wenxinia saemankumensis]
MGTGNDGTGPRTADIPEALGLLTRLPVPMRAPRGGPAAWAWPVAGLAVGALAWAAGASALALGLTPALAAGAALAASVLVTGALHEDGLADSADGLWGGRERARRLEIMKDSRIGAYGVIALVLGIGLHWAALAALAGTGGLAGGLLAAAALSRAAMAGLMAALPPARPDGLARSVGRPPARTAWLAGGIGAASALVALGPAGIWAILLAAGIAWGWGALARRRIGGQTGDILGAAQQLVSIAVLCVAVAAA